ncbi:hypothetical protein CDD83_6090 [Cordyceps sp. RAO-2017]|nr:hypothetical protein CDD83_6090 [Cordyceps sp. RAO-2017]
MRWATGITLLGLGALAASQGPPKPEGVLKIASSLLPGVDVTYKEVPAEICGTATSYAGYVNFPPNSMSEVRHDYPVHTFFWYFEAQKNADKAPLVAWVNGGPGGSSMFGLFTEHGPCQINSSLQASANPWSWNREYNVLYVDQPVHTGFSYDVATDGFFDVKTGVVTPRRPDPAAAATGRTRLGGVFSSQDPAATANTTENAARHYWNFLQVWTHDFLARRPHGPSMAIWTESYGGRYGPSFAAYIQRQNGRVRDGSLPHARPLNLTSLGIVNGCIDLLVQEPSYPEYAYDRNPFGQRVIGRDQYANALVAWAGKGGCRDRALRCLELAHELEPGMYGNETSVNAACKDASDFCQNELEGPYMFAKKYGYYDMRHCYLDPFPSNNYLEYLALERVQRAIGVPVNYTDASSAVVTAFNATGDYARRIPGGFLESIAGLLDAGIPVSLLYGDSDYACNWVGGERISLAVRHGAAPAFARAGYADVVVAGAPSPGQVRQHGLFSFVRVYQSGHMVPSSQPEAAWHLLRRAMRGKDLATGQVDVSDAYSTNGSFRSWTTLVAPASPAATCHVRGLPSLCSQNQIEAVDDGTALIENGVVVRPAADPRACPPPPSPAGT